MCFDYHENEAKKRRAAEAQAREAREEAERLRPRNKLPRDLSQWGKDTTARIYDALGIKGGKVPASMSGDFHVDGFRIRVKKASSGASRVFLVASTKRLVPIGRVNKAKFSAKEMSYLSPSL